MTLATFLSSQAQAAKGMDVATQMRSGWRLPAPAWLLIIPPILIFLASNFILTEWGHACFQLGQPWIGDGHAEAAGRLRSAATFLLYCAFGLAALAAACLILWPLSSRLRLRLIAAWLLTMALGIFLALQFGLDQGDPYLEQTFAEGSLGFVRPGQQQPAPAVPAKAPPPVRASITEDQCAMRSAGSENGLFDIPAPRASDGFRILRIMYVAAALLLFLAMPAVVWAAIACLALPETSSSRELHAAWSAQTTRLNRLLYLTAGFMVAGLLFSSARLNWPGYSLHPADLGPFREHVSSLVFYLGVANSILITSYYVPVAAWLAARRPRPASVPFQKGEADPAKGPDPYAAFRTAATILSPALVGLIGELVKFSG